MRKLIISLVVAATALMGTTACTPDAHSTTMTSAAYMAHRAAHVDEDVDGWDCRIDGNTECGNGDNAWYELICSNAKGDVCWLERHAL